MGNLDIRSLLALHLLINAVNYRRKKFQSLGKLKVIFVWEIDQIPLPVSHRQQPDFDAH